MNTFTKPWIWGTRAVMTWVTRAMRPQGEIARLTRDLTNLRDQLLIAETDRENYRRELERLREMFSSQLIRPKIEEGEDADLDAGDVPPEDARAAPQAADGNEPIAVDRLPAGD